MKLPGWVLPTAIALTALGVYGGVWSYGFASDDVALLYRLKMHGWDGISPFLAPHTGALGVGYQAYYRPFVVLFTASEYYLWGMSPAGYHITNWLVYGLPCVLVYLLTREVIQNDRVAAYAALLFALHPLHTLNVIWISGRTDLFAGCAILGSLFAYLRWRASQRKSWLALAAACEVCALGSKETAYLIPALAIVTEWIVRRREGEGTQFVASLHATAVLWVLPVLWGLMIALASPFVRAFDWTTSPTEVVTNLTGSLALVFIPVDYELLLTFATTHFALALLAAGCVALAGVFLWMWYGNATPAVVWGAFWVLVCLVPLYRASMRWYLFLPSVGACVLLAGLAGRFGRIVPVVFLFAFSVALIGERIKWREADAVGKTALASLLEPPGGNARERLVLLATPAKVRRMPVFAGNTESFYRMCGGNASTVSVITHVALDTPGARVETLWLDSSAVRISIASGFGSFSPLRRGSGFHRLHPAGPGDTLASDFGTVVVHSLDDKGLVVAVDASFDPDSIRSARWLGFADGRFVPCNPPSKG